MTQTEQTPATTRLLRPRDVAERIGMSERWLYQAMKENRFPQPDHETRCQRGKRAGLRRTSRWLASTVDRWIAEQVEASAA